MLKLVSPRNAILRPLSAATRSPPGAAQRSAAREGVGVDLAGVEEVGEAVDDRDRRCGREALNLGMLEGPDDDPVDEAGEDPRGVLDRLAAPELDVVLFR